jgi:hypothetical protein
VKIKANTDCVKGPSRFGGSLESCITCFGDSFTGGLETAFVAALAFAAGLAAGLDADFAFDAGFAAGFFATAFFGGIY